MGDFLGGGLGTLFMLFLLVFALALIVMPFYVINTNTHIRRVSENTKNVGAHLRKIRELEYARFVMYLKHSDVTLAELDDIGRTDLVGEKTIKSIVDFRKQAEANNQQTQHEVARHDSGE